MKVNISVIGMVFKKTQGSLKLSFFYFALLTFYIRIRPTMFINAMCNFDHAVWESWESTSFRWYSAKDVVLILVLTLLIFMMHM
mgnify:CR=1 FL=1